MKTIICPLKNPRIITVNIITNIMNDHEILTKNKHISRWKTNGQQLHIYVGLYRCRKLKPDI